MRFLIDANLPGSLVELIHERGHEAVHVRDIGLRDADDAAIAAYARQHECVLLTRDFDFADVRAYPPREYRGLVVFDLPETAVATTIRRLVESFLSNNELLEHLPERLAIVEFGRVRLRE